MNHLNHPKHLDNQQPVISPTQLSRKDFISAQLVEVGIVIQTIHGTNSAAAYLHSKKVAIDVAMRVLSQPLKRRTWRSWDYAKI